MQNNNQALLNDEDLQTQIANEAREVLMTYANIFERLDWHVAHKCLSIAMDHLPITLPVHPEKITH